MTIEHPYRDLSEGRWLIGNLHTHTTASDGERPHQEVIDDYASRGHGFLMISDHDVYTSESDYDPFKDRGLILVPGNEISAGGPHLLHVGATERVSPSPRRQQVVDDVRAGAGFAIFNHPNWQNGFNHCPQKVLVRTRGYLGLEIYNGVISRLEGSPYATNRWDMLLSGGRKLWGYANDDSHRAEGDVGWGWNAAYVRGDKPSDVVDALREGRFYASSGVVIRDIRVDGGTISVETENASRIVALKENATRFAQVDESNISVEAPEDAGYVRFECWGTGESFAWTQPFFVS